MRSGIIWTILILVVSNFISFSAYSIPKVNKEDSSAPAVLKAKNVQGNRIKNEIIAIGDVEVIKGSSVLFADKIIYNQNTKKIKVIGDFKVNDFEVGNLYGNNAFIKDDFSEGEFFDTKIVFDDGSYLKSPKVNKKSALITRLNSPVYSICPDPVISKDNKSAGSKRSFFSIKSSKTEIDKKEEVMRSKHAFLRVYDIPILYTPYISIALPSKKKKSGFLNPSYSKNSNLGLGVKLPYYFYISDSLDVTTTPLISVSGSQFVIGNELRHETKYGRYDLNLEVANNEITRSEDTNVVRRTQKDFRWNLKGAGKFDFDLDTGLDFSIDNVGDRDYLRDYHFNFINYTVSQVNLDNIKGRNYSSAKFISVQELEEYDDKKAEPYIIPLNYHVESNPDNAFTQLKEKYLFTTDFTSISRVDGLQYRRISAVPELSIPYNVKGNLLAFNTKIQGDFYSLDDNFKGIDKTQEYNRNQSNYSPEASINWRLPLIKKGKKNTLMIEPMANMVVSSFKSSNNAIPNEDSNDSELTVSNLFISDRISGYDRNESGKRINYGVKTSLFNDYGEFGLNIGQGYKRSAEQDVEVRGFNDNNKSNIVGQALYKANKYLTLNYSFQLDESNYSNDINQLNAALDFGVITFNTNYLLIRKTEQNANEKEQLSLGSSVKLTNKWKLNVRNTRDVVKGRDLYRTLSLTRDGCCTTFGFAVTETNSSNLTSAQKSFNMVLTFKNL